MGYTNHITKTRGDCSGDCKTPFSHAFSLQIRLCLSISAHVCTIMNICVYLCVYLCVHIYISHHVCICFTGILSFYSSLWYSSLWSPSWSWEIKQLESYWERENGFLLKSFAEEKSLSKWTRIDGIFQCRWQQNTTPRCHVLVTGQNSSVCSRARWCLSTSAYNLIKPAYVSDGSGSAVECWEVQPLCKPLECWDFICFSWYLSRCPWAFPSSWILATMEAGAASLPGQASRALRVCQAQPCSVSQLKSRRWAELPERVLWQPSSLCIFPSPQALLVQGLEINRPHPAGWVRSQLYHRGWLIFIEFWISNFKAIQTIKDLPKASDQRGWALSAAGSKFIFSKQRGKIYRSFPCPGPAPPKEPSPPTLLGHMLTAAKELIQACFFRPHWSSKLPPWIERDRGVGQGRFQRMQVSGGVLYRMLLTKCRLERQRCTKWGATCRVTP